MALGLAPLKSNTSNEPIDDERIECWAWLCEYQGEEKSNYNGEGRAEKRKTTAAHNHQRKKERKINHPYRPLESQWSTPSPALNSLMDSRDSPIGHLGSLLSVALPLRGA